MERGRPHGSAPHNVSTRSTSSMAPPSCSWRLPRTVRCGAPAGVALALALAAAGRGRRPVAGDEDGPHEPRSTRRTARFNSACSSSAAWRAPLRASTPIGMQRLRTGLGSRP